MQQAANNMIPVFEEIQQGNEAIRILNKNLKEEAQAAVNNSEEETKDVPVVEFSEIM